MNAAASSGIDSRIIISGLAAFGLVFSLWLLALLLWTMYRRKQTRQLIQRLGLSEEEARQTRVLRLWHEGGEATTAVRRGPAPKSFLKRFETLPQRAGWNASPLLLVLGPICLAVLVATIFYGLTLSLISAVVAGALVIAGFMIWVSQAVARQTIIFDQQLTDALELAARSLRAGHPLVGAFDLIAQEMGAPINQIFGQIHQQQSLGVSLEEGLRRVASQSASEDLQMVATSVVIQLRSGGNLADMMDRLAQVVRERLRLGRRIRVLTAQTQLSKRVLLALPLLLILLLNVVNPEYMAPLYYTTAGHVLCLVGLTGMTLGSWAMNRIAAVHY